MYAIRSYYDRQTVSALPETGAAPLITLRGVTKVYGKGQAAMHALRGIDLDIEPGAFVAMMGPSGSGKSTCMNILGCLDTPTAGSYRFEGVEVGNLTRNQRALLRRHYIGFVFQGVITSYSIHYTKLYDVHDPGAIIEALLQRVDVIPAGLALAQAANESAWGKSRFAREGNNLFGTWTYDTDNGIKPERRAAGKTHLVRNYDSLEASA